MMRSAVVALFAGILALAMPAGAFAQEGIAIVVAPEMSAGVCRAGNPEAGFACAREKCAAEPGVEAGDCLRVRWCYPAGWAADIFMQHKEGLHWHDYLCGWSGAKQLRAAVKAACDNEYLRECSVVQAWDADGKTVDLSTE
ncbi:MAG: hypothetical protein C0606_17540 [Hyphomicrobiales bacterium]|mgnify:CR=1 FL=1|nr:MAG: hypothetical protein C0606_17540 [Hyphomicrobiales bacterium]